ncbi:unnamed protein product [Meloidogyne enterolobii]|uniref:Uncharacterized protein n=1 Tax=Meloidogyne enterolobii TaxID=390850 RepID=A0ACB0ZFE8_MELEN
MIKICRWLKSSYLDFLYFFKFFRFFFNSSYCSNVKGLLMYLMEFRAYSEEFHSYPFHSILRYFYKS